MTDVLEQLRAANPVPIEVGYPPDEVDERVRTIITAGRGRQVRGALAAAAAVVVTGGLAVGQASLGHSSEPAHPGPAVGAFESTVVCKADRADLTAAQQDREYDVVEDRWLASGINRVTTSGQGYVTVNVPDRLLRTARAACHGSAVSIRPVVSAAPRNGAACAHSSTTQREALCSGSTRYVLGPALLDGPAFDMVTAEQPASGGKTEWAVRGVLNPSAARTLRDYLRHHPSGAALIVDGVVVADHVPTPGPDDALEVTGGWNSATTIRLADDIMSGAVRLRFAP